MGKDNGGKITPSLFTLRVDKDSWFLLLAQSLITMPMIVLYWTGSIVVHTTYLGAYAAFVFVFVSLCCFFVWRIFVVGALPEKIISSSLVLGVLPAILWLSRLFF